VECVWRAVGGVCVEGGRRSVCVWVSCFLSGGLGVGRMSVSGCVCAGRHGGG
jgi:hypothetical protein